jgi:hypothetical protein
MLGEHSERAAGYNSGESGSIYSIQLNSIYLCAKLNSHRPITKLAQVVQRRRSKELEV